MDIDNDDKITATPPPPAKKLLKKIQELEAGHAHLKHEMSKLMLSAAAIDHHHHHRSQSISPNETVALFFFVLSSIIKVEACFILESLCKVIASASGSFSILCARRRESDARPSFDLTPSQGTITSHALMSLEARGTLFVSPGMETYDGMIVGEHSRDTDLDINLVRTKELSNMCAACKEAIVKLTPPRLMAAKPITTEDVALTEKKCSGGSTWGL